MCSIAGYHCLDEVMGISAAELAPLFRALVAERPTWARAFRKILDSDAPPIEPKVKVTASEEADVYAKWEARSRLSGIRGGRFVISSAPRRDASRAPVYSFSATQAPRGAMGFAGCGTQAGERV